MTNPNLDSPIVQSALLRARRITRVSAHISSRQLLMLVFGAFGGLALVLLTIRTLAGA